MDSQIQRGGRKESGGTHPGSEEQAWFVLVTVTADMTRFARLALASIASLAVLGVSFGASEPAAAASSYTVSVAPTADTVALGETAIFRIRVEGQTASLPSFDFDVEGGTLAAVASIDPVAANVAEGAVFVTRETEGTARLTVRHGPEVLASGQAKFAPMGKVSVSITLEAGADAAARTWRFEVSSASGQVVASLSAGTSGDASTASVATGSLPYGYYTVRQVLGNDTALRCDEGAYYAVAAPVSGETTIELASNVAGVSFRIVPCLALPASPEVSIPVDSFAPGETPVSEVRGTRQEGPGSPLPPSAGNTAPGGQSNSFSMFALLLVTCAVATLLPVSAWSAATVRGRSQR
ncbi:MAG: hypothetical protein IPI85_07940 [Dehalococcoidia bacterium]|nr:hypothetical protein [Dehalococcoidia bacterium]